MSSSLPIKFEDEDAYDLKSPKEEFVVDFDSIEAAPVFESPTKMYFYIFCHPHDQAAIYRDFKGQGFDFSIVSSEYNKSGKPHMFASHYNGEKVGIQYMASRSRSLWHKWYEVFFASHGETKMIRLPLPHPRQKEIIYGKTRFKVMVCGRRFGKTTSALIACILQANTKAMQVIYYIAPTYKQAKNIAWGMLNKFVGNCYSRRNEQELVIEFYNGSKIYLKGADNADSLRGAFVHLAILDEFADMRPAVWDLIVKPMLLDTRGSAWFMGTPKGFDHFQEMFLKAASGDAGPDWRAFRLTSFDNPHLPKEELEKYRQEMDPRAFAQEIMAEFVQFEGLVYPDFEKSVHVKDFSLADIKGVDILGLDFGADHPTAGIFVRFTLDGKAYVWGEHYRANLSAAEHAEELKRIRGQREIRANYLDPSAKQFGVELRRAGIPTRKAVNDREAGVSKIRSMLRSGNLIIHPSCTNLIYEFTHHIYKENRKKDADIGQNVKKVDDDALDALRYAVASFYSSGKTNDWSAPGDAGEHSHIQKVPDFRRLGLKDAAQELNMVAPEFRD